MVYVSALIWNREGPYGQILALRGEDGKLHFPMTALHTAEAAPQAAARAAAEQLGWTVRPGALELRGRHKRPEQMYEYHEYYSAVCLWRGEMTAEPANAVWVHPSKLDASEFTGDDAKFVSKYVAWVNGREVCDTRMY